MSSTFKVMEFPWTTPVATGFKTQAEAREWMELHSGGVLDCRYVEAELPALRIVKESP